VDSTPSECVGDPAVFAWAPSDSDLTCEAVAAAMEYGEAYHEVPWAVDDALVPSHAHCGLDYCHADAAYSWAYEGKVEGSVTGTFSCATALDGTMLEIKTNGIPNHYVASYPMDYAGGTLGLDKKDNTNSIVEQVHIFYIPVSPTPYDGTRKSIINTQKAFSKYSIGFATNGVPFYASYLSGYDAVDMASAKHEMRDLCYGAPDSDGVYHYRSTPWCLFEDTATDIDAYEAAHGITVESA